MPSRGAGPTPIYGSRVAKTLWKTSFCPASRSLRWRRSTGRFQRTRWRLGCALHWLGRRSWRWSFGRRGATPSGRVTRRARANVVPQRVEFPIAEFFELRHSPSFISAADHARKCSRHQGRQQSPQIRAAATGDRACAVAPLTFREQLRACFRQLLVDDEIAAIHGRRSGRTRRGRQCTRAIEHECEQTPRMRA